MTTPTAAPVIQEKVSVPLRDVELELSRQMRALQGVDETPVLRACMSNLVIFCDRQGGRGHYGHLLRLMFEDWAMEIVCETISDKGGRSEYRCKSPHVPPTGFPST